MAFTRILVAIDASPGRQGLVEAAVRVARDSGAEALPFHALILGRRGLEGLEDIAREAASWLSNRGIAAAGHTAVCTDSAVSRSIVGAADRLEADLIVIGSTGLPQLRVITPGTVAHGVLVQTPRPVLLVRTRAGMLGLPPRARRVLVAVEGLREMAPLARAVRALEPSPEVVVAHVADGSRIESRRVGDAATELLGKVGVRCRVETAVAAASEAGRTIARLAAQAGVDLILLGAVPSPGGEGLLIGSTVRDVMSSIDLPVLVAERAGHAASAHAGTRAERALIA